MLRRRVAGSGWLFVAPAFLHLLIFALIPIGYAFYVSLFKLRVFKEEAPFVGLQNYAVSLGEDRFWNGIWNSFRYALYAVPAGIAVALLVAILVNQKLRGMTIYRTIFYMPAIMSGVAISMVWIYVYLPETGMLNTLIKFFGGSSKDFLGKAEYAMPALAFMSIWTGLGPRMVLFLAGLVNIPQSLYEAADLDGSTPVRSFWAITIPMLLPTTFFVLVTSTIGALQVFTPAYVMTRGGPEYSTEFIGYHIYTEAWTNLNTGLGSAKSFLLLAFIVLIALFQFRVLQRRLEEYTAA